MRLYTGLVTGLHYLGYTRSHLDTQGVAFSQVPSGIAINKKTLGYTKLYMRLHRVTLGYIELHSITPCYIHRVT